MSYLCEVRVAPWAALQLERFLPVRGEVLVAVGDRVAPDDIVARCVLPGGLHTLDLRQQLGKGTILLRKMVGDSVLAGEAVAERQGRGPLPWPRSTLASCPAPVDGRVLAIRAGRVMIEAAPQPFLLRAGMAGQVTGVLPERGVALSAAGAWIQGVWSNGKEAHGPLQVVEAVEVDRSWRAGRTSPAGQGAGSERRRPIGATNASPERRRRRQRMLPDDDAHDLGESGQNGPAPFGLPAADLRGCLLAAARPLDEIGLEFALEAGVRGIIVGGVPADLCARLESIACPVLVIEGFGALPMSRHAFALLKSCAGRDALLDGATGTGWATRRPAVLIPLDREDAAPPDVQPLQPLRVGIHVRGLRAPYWGVEGIVTGLPTRPPASGSEQGSLMVEVEWVSGEPAFIPSANLEIVEALGE